MRRKIKQSNQVNQTNQLTSLINELKAQINNTIDTKIRYYVEQRLSVLASSDDLLTRGSEQFTINEDINSNSFGKSFMFKSNGINVAKITSDGNLYVKNIWMNGINLLGVIQQFINNFNYGSNIYVQHTELKDGTYILDVDDITTKTITINEQMNIGNNELTHQTVIDEEEEYNELDVKSDKVVINSTNSTPLTILNHNAADRYTNININNSLNIIADSYENSLSLNGIIEAVEYDANHRFSKLNGIINYMLSNSTESIANQLIFGSTDSQGDSVSIKFNYVDSNEINNSLTIGFYDYNDLIKLLRNKIITQAQEIDLFNTNNDMTLKIGSNDANARNFMIYYDYMYNTSDCYATVGLQTHPALRFRTDKLELMTDLYYNNQLIDLSHIAYTNVNNTFTGVVNTFKTISSLSNWFELIDSSLAAGYNVEIQFGKSGNQYASGTLLYHLDSVINKSYVELKLTNNNASLKIYTDRVEFNGNSFAYTNVSNTFTGAINYFQQLVATDALFSGSLTVNNYTIDAANIAYKNIANTFTKAQVIQQDALDAYLVPLAVYSNKSITYMMIGKDNNNCLYFKHNIDSTSNQQTYLYQTVNGTDYNYITLNSYSSPNITLNYKTTINGNVNINTSAGNALNVITGTLWQGGATRITISDGTTTSGIGQYKDSNDYYYTYVKNFGKSAEIDVYDTSIKLVGNTTITSPTVITTTASDHPLGVYRSNISAGGSCYIALGKSDTQTTRCAFGYTHDDDGNANNNNFGWLYLQNYIMKFYNNRAEILKPLTVSGNTTINTGTDYALSVNTSLNQAYTHGIEVLAANLTQGNRCLGIECGKAATYANCGYMGFYYDANGGSENFLTFGIHSFNDVFRIYPYKIVSNNPMTINGKINGWNLPTDENYYVEPTRPYIATVKTDGVMEVGQYIDFHTSSVEDYGCRLQWNVGNSGCLETSRPFLVSGSAQDSLQVYNGIGPNYIWIGKNNQAYNRAVFGYRHDGGDGSAANYGLLWKDGDVLRFYNDHVDIYQPTNINGVLKINKYGSDALIEAWNTSGDNYIRHGNTINNCQQFIFTNYGSGDVQEHFVMNVAGSAYWFMKFKYNNGNPFIETHKPLTVNGELYAGTSTLGDTVVNNYLYVNQSVSATAYNYHSDRRLKENIEELDINESANIINNINTYRFNYKDDDKKKKRLGVIAQEVQELVPEIVNEIHKPNDSTHETYLGVDYIGLIPHLINTVKYQQSIIELMNKRIDELEKLIVNKTC